MVSGLSSTTSTRGGRRGESSPIPLYDEETVDGDVRSLEGLIATDRKKALSIVTDLIYQYSSCSVVFGNTCPSSGHAVSGNVGLPCAICTCLCAASLLSL